MSTKTVTVPYDVLIRALSKARLLYVAVAKRNGQDAGPDDECWTEFEALASYVGEGEVVPDWRKDDGATLEGLPTRSNLDMGAETDEIKRAIR